MWQKGVLRRTGRDSRAGACMRAQRKGHGRAEWEDSCLQTAKRGLQKPALLPLDHGLLVSYLRENKHLLVYFAWESKPTNTMVRLIMMMMINCNLSLWRAVWNEYQNSIQLDPAPFQLPNVMILQSQSILNSSRQSFFSTIFVISPQIGSINVHPNLSLRDLRQFAISIAPRARRNTQPFSGLLFEANTHSWVPNAAVFPWSEYRPETECWPFLQQYPVYSSSAENGNLRTAILPSSCTNSWRVSLVSQLAKNPPAMQESACNATDPSSIPGLGRCPGKGNSNPL